MATPLTVLCSDACRKGCLRGLPDCDYRVFCPDCGDVYADCRCGCKLHDIGDGFYECACDGKVIFEHWRRHDMSLRIGVRYVCGRSGRVLKVVEFT